MALELLRAAPERCLTVANLAGFIARPAEPGEADRMLQRRVFWGYGDADPVIPPSWIAATRAFLDAHTRCSEIRYPGLGHSISAAELDDLTLFWRRTVARADTV